MSNGVSGIAIDPNDSNTIYIATGDDDAGDSYSVGVMKSTDGGQTWNTTGLSYLWTLYKTTNEIFIDQSYLDRTTWVVKQAGNIVDFRTQTMKTTQSFMLLVMIIQDRLNFIDPMIREKALQPLSRFQTILIELYSRQRPVDSPMEMEHTIYCSRAIFIKILPH